MLHEVQQRRLVAACRGSMGEESEADRWLGMTADETGQTVHEVSAGAPHHWLQSTRVGVGATLGAQASSAVLCSAELL